MLQRRERQLHLVRDEHEDVVDRVLVAGRVQLDVPLQIAVFRLHLVEERDAVGDRHDEAGAELAKIFQQIERVRAVAKNVGFEFQVKVPAGLLALDGCERRCFRNLGDRSRRLIRRHEALEVVEDGFADDIVGRLRILDQRADIVLGGQRDRDQLLGRLDLALADAIEGGLEFVGEGGDLVEAEHRTRALDRVQGAEGGIDQFAVVGTLAEVEQGPFQDLEQLAGFLAKDLGRVHRTHARTSLATTASSCSGLNGFVTSTKSLHQTNQRQHRDKSPLSRLNRILGLSLSESATCALVVSRPFCKHMMSANSSIAQIS